MDVPKLFKPGQNLEKNTQRLAKEEVKMSKVKEKPKTEVDKMLEFIEKLESMGSLNPLKPGESEMDKLLKEYDYEEVKIKKKQCCEYFSKTTDFDVHKVFIKTWEPFGSCYARDYAYADVKPGKLEEFCKRYDRFIDQEMNCRFSAIGYLGGMLGGGFLGCLGEKIYSAFEANIPTLGEKIDYVVQTITNLKLLVVPRTMLVGFTATAAGICAGALFYPMIKHAINKKKLPKCYTSITYDIKEVIKATFE